MGNKVYIVWTKDGHHPWCESIWDSQERAIAEAQRRDEAEKWDTFWVTATTLNVPNAAQGVIVWSTESEESDADS